LPVTFGDANYIKKFARSGRDTIYLQLGFKI
jgi:hypothetical protein